MVCDLHLEEVPLSLFDVSLKFKQLPDYLYIVMLVLYQLKYNYFVNSGNMDKWLVALKDFKTLKESKGIEGSVLIVQ
jgi:hypothetical protein